MRWVRRHRFDNDSGFGRHADWGGLMAHAVLNKPNLGRARRRAWECLGGGYGGSGHGCGLGLWRSGSIRKVVGSKLVLKWGRNEDGSNAKRFPITRRQDFVRACVVTVNVDLSQRSVV